MQSKINGFTVIFSCTRRDRTAETNRAILVRGHSDRGSRMRRLAIGFAVLASVSALTIAARAAPVVLAQQQQQAQEKANEEESPEAKMAKRFPQKVRVGHLIGLPLLDENDVTLGHVQKVVRSPKGKIKLIVSYSKWFGWFGRPVAVPIEVVAILALQIDAVDMPREDFESEPTWSQGNDTVIANDEIIRIALARR